MRLRERIIAFQNQAEKAYEENKTPATFLKYVLAFASFLLSTLWAGLLLPYTLVRGATHKKNVGRGTVREVDEKVLPAILAEEKWILLDFWAAWCGPCIMMDPVLKEFARIEKQVYVGRINADKSRQVVRDYNIRGLPQLILIKNGQEIRRHAGPMTLHELKQFAMK